MKKGLLIFVGLLSVVLGFGQPLDSAAVRVLGARRVHAVVSAAGGVRVELRGVYMCAGLLWLSFRARNYSAIDFRGNGMQVVIRDKKAFRRRARQEVAMRVVYRGEPGVLGADSVGKFCVGLVPRVPGKEQELVVEWVERDGDRRILLRVKGRRVMRARRV